MSYLIQLLFIINQLRKRIKFQQENNNNKNKKKKIVKEKKVKAKERTTLMSMMKKKKKKSQWHNLFYIFTIQIIIVGSLQSFFVIISIDVAIKLNSLFYIILQVCNCIACFINRVLAILYIYTSLCSVSL